MNIKAITLSIISVAAAVAASQPVQAQEEPRRSAARWDFAPNVWKKETIPMPRGYNAGPAVVVKSGAVPSKNMLGLDPSYLAKAAPPPLPAARPLINVQQNVAAIPMAKPAQSPLEAFKAAFGKPISAAPVPMVASLPQSLPAAPMALPAAHHAAPAHAIHHAANLNGKLLTPQHPVARSAGAPRALPSVANYGSNFFTPGNGLAVSGNSGSGASTSVRATLWRPATH